MADTNLGFNPPNPFQPPPQQQGQQPQQGQPAQPHGQQAAPEPAADLQRPPVGAPGGPDKTPPTRIPIDFEEYQRFMRMEEEYGNMMLEQQRQLEQIEEDRIRTLAEKGNIEEAFGTYKKNYEEKLATFQKTLTDRETSWLNAEKSRVISEAMAGLSFIGDPQRAARAFRRLLEDEVEAVMGKDGMPVVRDRERGRPALEYLKERIEHPEFELNPLLKARAGGGAGTDGTRGAGPPPQPASGQPLTPEEAIKTWQRSQGLPSFGVHRIPRTG